MRRQFNWTNVPIAVAADRCLKGLKRALVDAELTMAVPPSASLNLRLTKCIGSARMLCNGSRHVAAAAATSRRPSVKKNLGRRARNWLPRSPRRRRQFVRRRGSGRRTMDCRQPAWPPPPGRSDRRGRALRALGARVFPSTTLQAFGSNNQFRQTTQIQLHLNMLRLSDLSHKITHIPSQNSSKSYHPNLACRPS